MYSGTIAPLVTPLEDSGIVSEPSVRRLIESLRDHVTALLPALSSGEGWALTSAQWRQMVAATQAHRRGLPVLAGIQLPDTSGVITRVEQAVELGVDAVVVSAPFGGEITQEEIYEHYVAIRAATEIPLFVYNEAVISGNHIELTTLMRICQLPDIVGIKDSSGLPELTRSIIEKVPDIPVFQGWEHLLREAPGVAGFIGPLANLEPALCGQMLVAPTARLQEEITEACVRYGLDAQDWYRQVKIELVRRGILKTDLVVAPQGVMS